ncbi:MAG: Mov34/MPN/PAD-1 family protein [Candidatus Hermodarchaeota archaeon]
MPRINGDDKMNVDENKSNSLRDAIKQKIKEKIKKELLEEVYTELQLEELQEELTTEIIEARPIDHSNELKAKLEPIPIEPVKTIANNDKFKAKIAITIKAILKIASHSLKYAHSKIPRDHWVEVIGLIAGRFDNDDGILHVEDVYPMGHGTAVYAEIKDYKNYVRAYKDIKKKDLFICGWYHSHPSYGCFMSREDLGTQARYQKLWNKAIALVIDPFLIDGKSVGFEIYRANFKTKKWYSVPFEIKGHLDVRMLPEIIEFMNPIIEGKPAYLEYDE